MASYISNKQQKVGFPTFQCSIAKRTILSKIALTNEKRKCYLKTYINPLCSVAGNTFRSDKQQILCRFNAFYCRGPYNKIFFYLSVQFDALLLLQSFILDILCRQPIKLFHVVSTSEYHEY